MGKRMEFTKFDELSERIRAGSYKNPGFLLELVDCAREYTREQMGQIRDRVCQEFYKPERSLGTVMTVLAEKRQMEELEQAGFCRMDRELPSMPDTGIDPGSLRKRNKNEDRLLLGYGFLEGSYRDFCHLTKNGAVYGGRVRYKDGREGKFNYQLLFSDQLLKKERILRSCGDLYGIMAPVIFSPLGRRLVKIQAAEGLALDDVEQIRQADLRLAENGLDKILLTDRELVWNVKLQDQDLDMRSQKGSLAGEEKHYIYTFDGCGPNQYIVPLEKDPSPFYVYRDKDKIRFQYTDRYTDRFAKITVKEIPKKPKDPRCFTNSHRANERMAGGLEQEIKVRLRSEADIWFTVKQHGAQLGMELERVSKEPLSDYREYEAWREKSPCSSMESLCLEGKGSVYLYFHNKEDSLFADDYMDYLCSYLGAMYPDIVWKGGYR